MTAVIVDLEIVKGKTFDYAFLYAEDDLVYRPITGIASLAPLRLTVPSHGLPDGWRVEIKGVKSPADMNTGERGPQFIKLIDADTIEINAMDGTEWRGSFSGAGNVVTSRPLDLTGWSARATVRDKIGGTELFRWHSDPLEAAPGLITLDVARSSFVLSIDAADTAALTWSRGVWEMEAVDPAGKVYAVVAVSRIAVTGELVI